jgi:hypothetical protein
MKNPTFRVWTTELSMRTLILAIAVLTAPGIALGAGKTRGSRRAPVAKTAPVPERNPEPRPAEPETAAPAPEPAETKPATTKRAKVYNFTGLDVEGKLKTPQLLYFLNRVKLELDTTGREKRSFLKELEQSSDDKGL